MKFKEFASRNFAAAAILLLICAGRAAASSEEISMPQLSAPVTVKIDKLGIPHIYASNEHDLFFVQGYITARDRLFQMDMNRVEVNGRYAEMRGEKYINHDFDRYKVGLPQVSQKIWDTANEKEKIIFQSYSDGVNAYITQLKQLPEEYIETGTKPRPWTPVDSIAIGRGVSWVMSSDLYLEAAIGVLVKKLGKTMVMPLLPINGMDPITIVKDETFSSFPVERFGDGADAVLHSSIVASGRTTFGSVIGSNNWVVSAKKSATGNALLSSDTHTGFPAPSLWYQVQLKSPGLNAMGISYPGTPGIMVGHNEFVSWAPTTTRYDVTDIYVEKPDPEKPETNYIYKGKSLPFEFEEVKINYSTPGGMKTETRKIKRTIHGPVIYEEGKDVVMTFRWTGHEPTHEGRAFYGFMTARNLDDFKAGLDQFDVGGMNFVYADVFGNIYYRGQAKVPIRKGTAYMPLDGSSGDYEWTGYIPNDKLPHAENPPDGFIATANNKQASKAYPYYLGVFYDKGYRARRISDLLAKEEKVTFKRMQEIQFDNYSYPAEVMLPMFFDAAAKNDAILTDDSRKAIEMLKAWDKHDRAAEVQPSIFYKWLKHITLNTFGDEIPPEHIGNLARSEVVFPYIVNKKKGPLDFFNNMKTPEVETKEIIFARSLNDAVAELKKQLGEDMNAWTWGKIHRITQGHPLGGKYNIGPFEADGGMDTVNVADFGLVGEDFDFGHGPSERMTIDMNKNGVFSENVIVGGQSGDRNNARYADETQLWLKGRTHAMYFADKDVDAAVETTMTFSPK